MGDVVFDKLSFVDRLTAGGIAESQARAHADALDIAMRETVATKADIAGLKADIALESAAVRGDVKADIARLEGKVFGELRLVKWMLALVIAATVIPLIRAFL